MPPNVNPNDLSTVTATPGVEIDSKAVGEQHDTVDVENNVVDDNSPKRTKPFIVLVAACAALGGLIFGYDVAGAGATFVMDGFKSHFNWICDPEDSGCVPVSDSRQSVDQGLINGLFGAGATVGAIVSPYFADKLGRRKTLGLASLIFIFGAALQTFAINMSMLQSARIFSGYGIGSLSMSSPVYIAECAPEHARGMLGTLWQVAITTGILIASAANLGLQNWDDGWRVSYGGNILFALFLLGALVYMPESPRWLAAHGNDDEAKIALSKLRYENEVDKELEEIRDEVKEEKALGVASWTEVHAVDNKMRYRLYLGIALQGIQQLSGINAIMFYAPKILEQFFSEEAAVYGTFVLNVINFLATFITLYAVDRFGRVILLFTGGIVCTLSLIANSILSSLNQTEQVGYVVILFSAIFIIGFAYSWGPVVWVVCSELFPLRARGKATGLTTMTNWLCTTIVGAIFPIASDASLSGCFGFFAVMIFIGTWMVYFLEAETAKRTILEIDEEFKNHKPLAKREKWR